jgi:hypothetical protein
MKVRMKMQISSGTPADIACPAPRIVHELVGRNSSRDRSGLTRDRKIGQGFDERRAACRPRCGDAPVGIIVFEEAHQRRILRKYAAYYNESRIHCPLNKYAPLPARLSTRHHDLSLAVFIFWLFGTHGPKSSHLFLLNLDSLTKARSRANPLREMPDLNGE